MADLLQFSGVACADWARPHSFTLHTGETRLLQMASEAEKEAAIDVALGNRACDEGMVLLQGMPLRDAIPGSVGWVAANGGLISNLKVWENVTLPLWYHAGYAVAETEQRVAWWLSALGMAEDEREAYMEATPDRLGSTQRKLAGLLRGLVQMPLVLVVDAALFEGAAPQQISVWTGALETYAAQSRAVLAVADRGAALTWQIIE